jgi:urea transport system substrate-binding protein
MRTPEYRHVNSPPASSVLPAVDYLMGEGVSAKRFFMLGSDCMAAHHQQATEGLLEVEGHSETAWKEEYVHSDFPDPRESLAPLRIKEVASRSLF